MAELFCTGIYLKAVGKEEGREKRYANSCDRTGRLRLLAVSDT